MAIGTSDGQQFPDSISFELAQLRSTQPATPGDSWDTGGWDSTWKHMLPYGGAGGNSQSREDAIKKHPDMEYYDWAPGGQTPGGMMFFRPPQPKPLGKGQQEDLVSDNSDVHIIRHGSTDYNSDEKVRSWSNVPLNDDGKKESLAVAQKLKDSGIEVLFHSDLDRAADTAKDISKTTKAELVSMPDFRSWHAGELTGKKYSEANPMMMDHAHNKPDEPLPGGESFNEFKQRVFAGLDKAEQYANGRQSGIVTHRGVERLLNAWDHHGQPETGEVHLPTFFDEGQDTGSVQKLSLFNGVEPSELGFDKSKPIDPKDIIATQEAQMIKPGFFSRFINDKAFKDAVDHMPMSSNVEDRRNQERDNIGKIQWDDIAKILDQVLEKTPVTRQKIRPK